MITPPNARFLPLFIAAVLGFQSPGFAENKTKISFSADGLSSIKNGAKELYAGAKVGMGRVTNQAGAVMSMKLVSSTFNEADKTLTNTYDWGTFSCTYTLVEDGLRIKGVVNNTSQETISSLQGNLITLNSLGEGKPPRPTFCVGEPPFVSYAGSEGVMVFGAENQTRPMQLTIAVDKKSRALTCQVGMGGGKVPVDNMPMELSLLPGGKEEFNVILRLSGPGTDPLVIAKDFLDGFRTANPSIFDWPDRRPILRLFFGGGLSREEAVANLKNPEAATLPEPDAKFREQTLKRMQDFVATAKVLDAQGVVLWDLEGQTFPHATTYIGDPRLMRLLNPQMELVVDSAVKILKEGGIKVGVTLRPSRVIYDEEKNSAKHSYTVAADPFLELDAKVAYAKKRWGCEIFYVDTNFFYRPYGPEKKWESGPIAPPVWRQLREKYPDTLFIPEFTGVGDYASVAGYGEADMGDYGMPAVAAKLYPKAFRVIVIEDADAAIQYDRFVDAVRHNNVLMTYAFSPENFNAASMMHFKKEAALLDAGMPESVKGAQGEKLVTLLASRDAAARFFAAQQLVQQPLPSAAPALLKMATNESEEWVVRRKALVALGKIPYQPAVPVLMDFLDKRDLGFYAVAAKALVGQDASVEDLVIEQLRTAVSKGVMGGVYDRYGVVLIDRKAVGKAAALQALFSEIPENSNYNRSRMLLLIGSLRSPESEPFLVTQLADEKLAPAAAKGLVMIGSESGLAQVKAAIEEAKKAGRQELMIALGQALQAK